MLTIIVPSTELYDERTGRFINIKETKLRLEHSLISASSWESKWKRCFLSEPPKTQEEIRDYVKCMCLNKDVDDKVFIGLTANNIDEIFKYIEDPMTATKITPAKKKPGAAKEILTTEVLYGKMALLSIPFTCEKWHLNRLIKLIEVCAANNSEPEKMSKSEIYKQNKELNRARRMAHHSRG